MAMSISLFACGYSSAPPDPKDPPNSNAPAITQQPASQTVTAGQAATFSVMATGTAPLSYQWYVNSAAAGTNSSSFTVAAATAGETGAQIYVKVSNTTGSVTSATVTLTVNATATAPAITQQPTNATVTAGQAAAFSVTATGTTPLTYQWFMNGTASGTNSSTFSIAQTTTGQTGAQIHVKVTNIAGSATSNTVALTVNPPAPTAPAITSATTASGTIGNGFSYQIAATNTPTSYAATGLPAGLAVNTGTGLISGTPTVVGISTASLSATNAAGTGQATLTVTVNVPALVFLTTALPNGRIGSTYSATLSASGGTTPYTWTLTSGTLPAGLSLNASSGAITGTPTQAVTNAGPTFEVSDSSSPVRTQTASLAMTVGSSQGQMMALSSNRKYLVNTITGKPVFVVGDDAFDLAVMLDSSDVSTYLNDRASRGFNAIWVGAVDGPAGDGYSANPPKNFYGYAPFDGADFTNEDANYWSNVDSVVSEAQSVGITVFLNPFFPGNGSEAGYVNSALNASDATMSAYGTFLGQRYSGYTNIVWLLGGDSLPSTSGLYKKLNDVGAAIAAADPNHLITLEACEQCVTNGYNSVQAYQAQSLAVPSWLTINWAYPQLTTTIAAAQNAYNQSPFLAPLCGENFYELENSLTELNVRYEQYSEILSGCYVGRIFGNGAIWSFNSPNGGSCCTSGSPSWQSQLGSAGSLSQEYQGRLFSSREHWLLVPDINHTVVTAGYGSGLTTTTAARTSDGQTIIAYIPNGNATAITVAMNQITSSSSTVQAWWFNPSSGVATNAGTFSNSGSRSFTAPSSSDWVLVLDDASVNLPTP
jgi:Protein of unknown function (DUF4038)/Putative collagen-binding domain of a collagenase/Putative Ig domain/Immunoglobulin I-set domain